MSGLSQLVAVVFAVVVAAEAASVLDKVSQHENLDTLSRQKRVIGGEPVEPGEWPWLARLKGKVPKRLLWGFIPIGYNNYYCGAAVLNDRWLLAAAHCFKQRGYPSRTMTPKYWHIKVGEVLSHTHWYDRFTGNADIHAHTIIVHPQYSESRSWQHDIALIRLRDNIPSVTPVRLPSNDLPANWPADGTHCVIKGWGCTSSGGPLSDHAQMTVLPKFPDGECQNIYGVSMVTRICAGELNGNNGICNGDSGGPLVCLADLGGSVPQWVQAGIASFTSADSPGNYPGVFTRVTEYTDWINANIN